MQRLVYLLQNSSKHDVQEMAISGISAIAASNEVSFAPHYPVRKLLSSLLTEGRTRHDEGNPGRTSIRRDSGPCT